MKTMRMKKMTELFAWLVTKRLRQKQATHHELATKPPRPKQVSPA
jgi:hypothetical protein